MTKHRIIQWGTGGCGRAAMREIIASPDLALVGARVYGSNKAGRDIGELCGLAPLGIQASNDEAEILARPADCVLWMGAATMFAPGASIEREMEGLSRILRSGKNVISIVHTPFVHPPSLPSAMRDPIEAACRAAGVSFLATGIDPGFVSEGLALAASGVVRRIESLTIREIADYAKYQNAQIIYDVMGFGRSSDAAGQQALADRMAQSFGSSLRLIGDALGAPVDNVRAKVDAAPAERDLTVVAGVIPKDTVAALRFRFEALVKGEPRFVIERIARMHPTCAPDWPRGDGHGVSIRGEPCVELTFHVTRPHNPDGLKATSLAAAMHAVNAVPALCAAPPGIRTLVELPRIPGSVSYA